MSINQGIIASQFDYDALLFLSAAGITDPTQRLAINYLTFSLKLNGLWDKLNAIYPMVGGTATTHKFNLKNPADTNAAFRLNFVGGWSHSLNGALPNGTNAYANTFLTPSTSLSLNSTHLSYYSRTNQTGTRVEMGVNGGFPTVGGQTFLIYNFQPTVTRYVAINVGGVVGIAPLLANTLGLLIENRRVSTSSQSFKSGVLVNTEVRNSLILGGGNIYIGALNTAGTENSFSGKQCAFATIGSGFTDAEALIFYNIVQAFQTILGRQV